MVAGSRQAGEEARLIEEGGLVAGEGDAADAIDWGAVEGDADAAADRTLDVGLSGRRYHSGRVEEKVVHRHRNRMAQTRAVDGTFGSDHEPWIELIIESDMGAADHCLQRLAERPSRKTRRRRR
jgi:hypothetical protein